MVNINSFGIADPCATVSRVRYLFIICLIFIAFMTGALSVHMSWPGAIYIRALLEGGDAWVDVFDEKANPRQRKIDSEEERNPVPNAKIEWQQGKTYGDYTLFTVRSQKEVYLVDMTGKIAHRWQVNLDNIPEIKSRKKKIGLNVSTYMPHAYVYPNGDLLLMYSLTGYTPYGAGMMRLDQNSNVLWTQFNGGHHGFDVDEATGNVLMLGHKFTNETPTASLQPLHYPLLDDMILVLSPKDGTTIKTISMLNAFAGTAYEQALFQGPETKKDWDLFHTNSVEELTPEMAAHFPMFKPGYLLLSFRNMNAFAVIDPETEKLVLLQYGVWKHQHSAHFSEDGTIVLFDNEGYAPANKMSSRIIHVKPGTGEITYSFAGEGKTKFFSSTWGKVKGLPNGNHLVVVTNHRRMFEVDKDGTIVWSFVLPGLGNEDMNYNSIYFAERYTKEQLPFLRRDESIISEE